MSQQVMASKGKLSPAQSFCLRGLLEKKEGLRWEGKRRGGTIEGSACLTLGWGVSYTNLSRPHSGWGELVSLPLWDEKMV